MNLLALLLLVVSAGAQEAGPVAGGVVRSKEWKIRRFPQREEEFIGKVSYRRGPSALSSDWALFRHEPQTWEARGDVLLVHGLRSGDRIEVSGAKAFYDQKTQKGLLVPALGAAVAFKRTPAEGGPDQGVADRLEWEGQELVRLTGAVHVWGPRLELWGGHAEYIATESALTLTRGRPVLQLLEGDWTGAVQADAITAYRAPESIQAEGRTRGWIRFKEKLEDLAR